MITEQELKEKCTPEFIKWMVELAEGFELKEQQVWSDLIIYKSVKYDKYETLENLSCPIFPLLIHRAVEGWNRLNKDKAIDILNFKDYTQIYHIPTDNKYDDIDYQPQSLTQAECAMLHCLQDIFLTETGGEG